MLVEINEGQLLATAALLKDDHVNKNFAGLNRETLLTLALNKDYDEVAPLLIQHSSKDINSDANQLFKGIAPQ